MPGCKPHVFTKIRQGVLVQAVARRQLRAPSPHRFWRPENISDVWNVLAVAPPLGLVGRLHPPFHSRRLRSGERGQEPHVVIFLPIQQPHLRHLEDAECKNKGGVDEFYLIRVALH